MIKENPLRPAKPIKGEDEDGDHVEVELCTGYTRSNGDSGDEGDVSSPLADSGEDSSVEYSVPGGYDVRRVAYPWAHPTPAVTPTPSIRGRPVPRLDLPFEDSGSDGGEGKFHGFLAAGRLPIHDHIAPTEGEKLADVRSPPALARETSAALSDAPASNRRSTTWVATPMPSGGVRTASFGTNHNGRIFALQRAPSIWNAFSPTAPGAAARLHSLEPEPLKEEAADQLQQEASDPFTTGKSFGIFPPNSVVRRFAIRVLRNKYFRVLIFLLIWFSAASAIVSVSQKDPKITNAFNISDFVILAIFVVELLLKMIAQGVILNPGSYFRSPADCLDFLLVVTACLAFLGDVNGIKTLRLFRALRPLRSVKFLSGVVGILGSLQRTLPMLVDNVLLLLFCFILFGAFAVEFYRYSLSRVCVSTETGETMLPTTYCKNTTSSVVFNAGCSEGFQCATVQNPNYGFSSFDNFPSAMLVMFQIVTLDGWSGYMFALQDAELYMPSGLWFVFMISVSVFVVVNLFVAVITGVFSRIRMESHKSAFVSRKKKSNANDDDEAAQNVVAKQLNRAVEVSKEAARRIYSFVPPPPAVLRKAAKWIMDNTAFQFVVSFTILCTAVVQSMQYDTMSQSYEDALAKLDYLFIGLFIFEMAVKLFALGIWGYFRVLWNLFDASLVIASIVNLVVQSHNVSFLRVVRMMRVLRLVQRLEDLRFIIRAALKGVPPVLNLCAFATISMLIFAVLGYQLFNNQLDKDSRKTFDGFFQSLLTLFVIMTADQWTDAMYLAMKSAGVFSFAYFISYYILISWVLLNMFTALIIENFAAAKEELALSKEMKRQSSPSSPRRGSGSLRALLQSALGRKKARAVEVEERSLPPTGRTMEQNQGTAETENGGERVEDGSDERDTADASLNDGTGNTPVLASTPQPIESNAIEERRPVEGRNSQDRMCTDVERLRAEVLGSAATAVSAGVRVESLAPNLAILAAPRLQLHNVPVGEETRRGDALAFYATVEVAPVSCFCLGMKNPVRRFVARVVAHPLFELFDITAVVASVVVMTYEPAPSAWTKENNSNRSAVVTILDSFFLGFFSLQLVARGIAFGWLRHRNSLFRSPWNWIDLMVVVAMALAWVFPFSKGLRHLRVFRPLRFVRKVETLRLIIYALVSSLRPILHVLFVTMFFFFAFALMGLELFMGAFYYCNDPAVERRSQCVGLSLAPDTAALGPRVWSSPYNNFDNIITSWRTLIQVASLSDWQTVMWAAMDIKDIDLQPQRNANPLASLYFIAFVVICGFFMVNIFVGVIVENIDNHRTGIITERQRLWQDLKRSMLLQKSSRKPPRLQLNRNRQCVHDFVGSRKGEGAVLVMIVLHVVVLSTYNIQTQPQRIWKNIVDGLNWAFICLYWVETALKLYAWRTNYFHSYWNLWDFFCIAGTTILAILQGTVLGNNLVILALTRLFRVLRIFRLVRVRKGLETLFNTLVISLPSILNISLLNAILMISYALTGRVLFGATRYRANLNKQVNFRRFARSMFMLFRNLTVDDWTGIMRDCAVLSRDECTSTAAFDDCGSSASVFFFCSFFIVGAYVFMNLVLSIMLDNFQHCFTYSRSTLVSPETWASFKTVWREYDTRGLGYVPQYLLPHILQHLYSAGNVLGFSPLMYKNRALLIRFQIEFEHRNPAMKWRISYQKLLRTLVVNRLRSREELLTGRDLDDFHVLQDLASVRLAAERVVATLRTNWVIRYYLPKNFPEQSCQLFYRIRCTVRTRGQQRAAGELLPPGVTYDSMRWLTMSVLQLWCYDRQEAIPTLRNHQRRRLSGQMLDVLSNYDAILLL